ncbi:hypothetical protein [Nocardia acididurans]|nr:hypothetical protein [Nocardia acididurans]
MERQEDADKARQEYLIQCAVADEPDIDSEWLEAVALALLDDL